MAIELLAVVQAQLANGVKHYAGDRLLSTEKDIIEHMIKGPVVCDNSERQYRVDPRDVFDELLLVTVH
jgi:hypothetical protein